MSYAETPTYPDYIEPQVPPPDSAACAICGSPSDLLVYEGEDTHWACPGCANDALRQSYEEDARAFAEEHCHICVRAR